MPTQFRQLRCKCQTRGTDSKTGLPKICNAFLGNIEAYKDVRIQLPCHLSAGHKNKELQFMTEWHQDEYGAMGYKVLPKSHKANYVEDDQIYPRGENG